MEWIAYHRVIGFDRLVLVSNNCTDGSDDLLDALAAQGAIEHHSQEVPDGVAPQYHAAEMVKEMGTFADGEWVMFLDIDEYLNIHTPKKRVGELIDRIGPADGMAITWRFFGDAGLEDWPGRHLSEKLTRCSWRFFSTASLEVKTLFRMSPDVFALSHHRPVLETSFVSNGRWFVDAAGWRMPRSAYLAKKKDGQPEGKIARWPVYRFAQVNHYAVRTPTLFRLRKERGLGASASRQELRHNKRYYERFNKNTRTDRSILAMADATEAELSKLRALPGVAEAEAACQDRTLRQLAKLFPDLSDAALARRIGLSA